MKNSRIRAQSVIDEPTQTLKEIDQEIAKLKERAASIVQREKAGVIDRIKEAIAYYSLTAEELGLTNRSAPAQRKPSGKSAKPVAKAALGDAVEATPATPPVKQARAGAGIIKFRDGSGNTWSGFGPKPRWLRAALDAGKVLEDLRV